MADELLRTRTRFWVNEAKYKALGQAAFENKLLKAALCEIDGQ